MEPSYTLPLPKCSRVAEHNKRKGRKTIITLIDKDEEHLQVLILFFSTGVQSALLVQ